MPDLSTVYLPTFPELATDAGGGPVGDQAGDVAADEAAASAPASGSGGGGDHALLEECRWSSRVRTFDVAASEGEGAMAPRGAGGGKKLSSAPSSTPVRRPTPGSGRTLEDCLGDWAARKVGAGIPACHCELPFLTGAPKAVECRLCSKIIYAGEEIKCSVSRCREKFHLNCVVKDTVNFTADGFKCPQHACMVCKQKMFFWRCGRCTVAAHTKCAPWPLIHLKDDQGSAICWRHPSDWLLQNENAGPTDSIEEVFCRLPLPYVNEDFNIDSTIRDFAEAVYKPPPYTLIRRSILSITHIIHLLQEPFFDMSFLFACFYFLHSCKSSLFSFTEKRYIFNQEETCQCSCGCGMHKLQI